MQVVLSRRVLAKTHTHAHAQWNMSLNHWYKHSRDKSANLLCRVKYWSRGEASRLPVRSSRLMSIPVCLCFLSPPPSVPPPPNSQHILLSWSALRSLSACVCCCRPPPPSSARERERGRPLLCLCYTGMFLHSCEQTWSQRLSLFIVTWRAAFGSKYERTYDEKDKG